MSYYFITSCAYTHVFVYVHTSTHVFQTTNNTAGFVAKS